MIFNKSAPITTYLSREEILEKTPGRKMKKITAAINCPATKKPKLDGPWRACWAQLMKLLSLIQAALTGPPEICAEYGARVVSQEWLGYREQKQFATDLAGFDWVLSMDADEELSAELREEIIQWKSSSENGTEGFFLPRMTWLMGSWIKHTTWYPDWQLRLFRKSKGKWTGLNIHESFRVDGKTAEMSGHLAPLHLFKHF